MFPQSFHKTCEIAKPGWQGKTQEEKRSEMQDFVCPKQSPALVIAPWALENCTVWRKQRN